MQVCFTSDLHGDTALYEQLGALLRTANPDLLILGGDLMRDGRDEDPVGSQVDYVERIFRPRVAEWKIAAPALTIACIAGNHEWSPALDALRVIAHDGLLHVLDATPWAFGGFLWQGYSCTPPTPHDVKDFERRDMPADGLPDFDGAVWDAVRGCTQDAARSDHFSRQPTLAEDLATLPHCPDPWILVAHAPPQATKLDRLPGLSYPIGSQAIRAFIAERQPRISLHGHVHESPSVTGAYTDHIGRTLCINPGQAHDHLHAVLFDPQQPEETLRHTVLG